MIDDESGPLLDVTATILAMKWEDSGLFLASKWPFDTVGVPPDVAERLGPAVGTVFPAGVPVVSFLTYGSCSGVMGDCRAAKGVLHARIRRNAAEVFDVFASHTQADDDVVDENRAERDAQMAQAWEFIKSRTGGPPFPRPVFFLGDFNILGGAADAADKPAQWAALFDTPGAPFTDHLADLWGTRQCRGGNTGLVDPGFTADVKYKPLRQRLDFALADPGPDLVVQHVRVDYDLAAPPVPPIDGVSYVSDHLPLSVDLASPHAFASPQQALAVSSVDVHDGPRLLNPGATMWYRFDQQGTYEFRLTADQEVYFEIYLGSDLSRPRKPYRNERHPDLGARFVLVAPFFVKVGNRRRDREFTFRFHSHRHDGRDPSDPIHLIPGVHYPETFPDAQQLNGDLPLTPWDDTDTKWFMLNAPRVAVDKPIRLRVELTQEAGRGPLSLLVALVDPGNPPQLVKETPPARGPHVLEWKARPADDFFVCVRRHNPAFAGVAFTLMADTDLTLLRGGDVGMPRLVCTEETSGWGADDIALELRADAAGWFRSLSNDEIGDFEQDAVRDLRQWIPQSVPYQDGFTAKVIEEDDIDADDVGQQTIPKYADVLAWDRWTVIAPPDGEQNLQGAVTIDVDDGKYTLRCVVSRWDETL